MSYVPRNLQIAAASGNIALSGEPGDIILPKETSNPPSFSYEGHQGRTALTIPRHGNRFSRWNPQWRAQFRAMKADLGGGLKKNGVSYLTIEHVGSTSIAHLVAKPMLDILIVVADADFNDSHRERLKDVLCFSWDLHPPGYPYKVVAENSIYRRSCLAFKDTLKTQWVLRQQYGQVKQLLARTEIQRIMQYSTAKNEIVRKVLKKAGWTDAEADEKEGMVKKWYPEI